MPCAAFTVAKDGRVTSHEPLLSVFVWHDVMSACADCLITEWMNTR